MKSYNYQCEPYVGAIPITFMMSPADVERTIGPPKDVGANDSGEREERRNEVTIRYSDVDDKVSEITFLPTAELSYRGRILLKDNDVIRFLSQHDIPYEFVGFIFFMKLGIMLTGFHDNDDSQKAITVFRKGRCDEFRSEMIPYELPKA